MERARPKEDYASSAPGLGRNGWDATRFGKTTDQKRSRLGCGDNRMREIKRT